MIIQRINKIKRIKAEQKKYHKIKKKNYKYNNRNIIFICSKLCLHHGL